MLTLNDGRNELWQWDTGRKLTVGADCSQVHFSNKVFGRSVDVDVIGGIADIPDFLLQSDKDLNAWAFVGTAENGYTKTSKVFKVNKRNKPADYLFTPTDQTTIGELVERLEKIEETQDPDAIKRAVDDYLASNPIQIDEKDPTVPAWAKQPKKPTYTAEEVGAQPKGDYVLYAKQELTKEQQAQARENIGAMSADTVISLTTEQVNALDALFKATPYIKDVSAEYAAFCDAFGLVNPDEPDVPDEPSEDVVVQSVKKGSVSLEGSNIRLNTGWDARAVLVPIGQYLKNGTTYKFSLGSVAGIYNYGVIVWGVDSAGYTFPYTDAGQTFPVRVTRVADAGYQTGEYTFTPDRDNCIFTVNFKKGNDKSMGDADYDTICKNFTIEEVV